MVVDGGCTWSTAFQVGVVLDPVACLVIRGGPHFTSRVDVCSPPEGYASRVLHTSTLIMNHIYRKRPFP